MSGGNIAMPVYLLQESAKKLTAVESALRAAIPDLIAATSLDAVLKTVTKRDPDEPAIVLVVVPQDDHAYFDRLVDVAGRRSSEIFLILIGDEISASDYKRLLRTGGADWASVKASPSEVVDIIARRQAIEIDTSSTALRFSGRPPVTISFVPSAGGVGNSTLAVETAAHVKTNKSTRHRKVCLVDLDFQTSHICDYLDSEPRLQIGEFSSAPDRLDEHLFESFKSRHSSGLDVFAAPRSKFLSDELNINALDALFSMIARRYDLVFIDNPMTWFAWTPQIVAASDGAIITGINTIPCLRQVSETLALVRSSGSAVLKIGIAINKCERNVLGSISRRKHVEMVLRDERLFFVANRLEAVESVNMGVPMMLGAAAGKLRKEFASLADFCAKLESRRVVSV